MKKSIREPTKYTESRNIQYKGRKTYWTPSSVLERFMHANAALGSVQASMRRVV
jgi:hypothetical protein